MLEYLYPVTGAQQYHDSHNTAIKEFPEPTHVYEMVTSYGVIRIYEWPPVGMSQTTIRQQPEALLVPGDPAG